MTIYRYVMSIMKMTKIDSLRGNRFLAVSRVKDSAKNGPEPKIPLLVVPRYFVQLNSKNNGLVLLFKTIIRH